MALVKNPWVTYINRSYQEVKASVITRIKTTCPEITDLSDSNILVIIISIFAGIAEMLNYYIDNMARESFIETCRRFSSMVKLVKLINYKIRTSISASSDVTFSFVDGSGNPVEAEFDYVIPAGTEVATDSGQVYITTDGCTILAGETGVTIGVRQRNPIAEEMIGTSTGTANQFFPVPSKYEHNSASLIIDLETWSLVDFLDNQAGTAKVFTINTRDNGVAYVEFGNDVMGKIPPATSIIYMDYFETNGSLGNTNPNTITKLNSTLTIPVNNPVISEIKVTNPIAASGGQDPETLEVIRKLAPLSLRTLNRAVTRQDYIDIAKLAPGVDKADLYYNCGKHVEIYISPVGGGIASTQLCSDTKAFIDEKKMITTFIRVSPAGETYIGLTIDVTGKFRVSKYFIEDDVNAALLNKYSYVNSDINKPVRTSDIIALIDNLDKIDYLVIAKMFQIPYARPTMGTYPLTWTRSVSTGCVARATWRLVFVENPTYALSYFKVYRNNIWQSNVNFDEDFYPGTGAHELDFRINSADNAGIPTGNSWTFITYPYNQDIVLDDHTLPIIDLAYVTLNITEKNYVE